MARLIRLRLDDSRCRLCRRCSAADICKVRAIVRLDRDEAPYIDLQRCYDCRLCLAACPFEAVVMGQL